MSALRLASCTNLRRLTLYNPELVAGAVVSRITQIRSTLFQELTLGTIFPIDAAHIPNFASIAGFLDTGGLPTMRRLTFLYKGTLPEDAVLASLQTSFPVAKYFEMLRVVRVA